jgi:hypothetical protein|nr:MAG TPA: Protein of unknown function (DUF739) [Caudoviricetes sp.]
MFRKRNKKTTQTKINSEKRTNGIDSWRRNMLQLVQKREQEVNTMKDPVFDYARLRGRIKEVFGTQDAFADAIGLGRVSVSQRLNNQLEFSQQEMFRSADVLGFSRGEIPEYFFTEKVQKHEQK